MLAGGEFHGVNMGHGVRNRFRSSKSRFSDLTSDNLRALPPGLVMPPHFLYLETAEDAELAEKTDHSLHHETAVAEECFEIFQFILCYCIVTYNC
jgi:hypothetical protein